jgi:hypothetical protein
VNVVVEEKRVLVAVEVQRSLEEVVNIISATTGSKVLEVKCMLDMN